MRRPTLILALLAAFCFPQFAMAWNYTGHLTVALLAFRRLDDVQRKQVVAILKNHPHYKLYLTQDLPKGISEDEWTFLRASAWSDFVRPAQPGTGATFKDVSITRFNQSPWHYTDIPFVPSRDRRTINPATLPAPQTPNILTALDDSVKKLRSADTSPEDRAVALAWLEHLVGDLHQPLHSTSMISVDYPGGDRGGNEQAVRDGEKVINLHAYWDDALGSSYDFETIVAIAGQIANDPKCNPQAMPKYKSHTTFDSWANESHDVCVESVYLNGRLKTAPMAQFKAKQINADAVPELPKTYEPHAKEVAQKQAALAAARLADQLKQILAARPTNR